MYDMMFVNVFFVLKTQFYLNRGQRNHSMINKTQDDRSE